MIFQTVPGQTADPTPSPMEVMQTKLQGKMIQGLSDLSDIHDEFQGKFAHHFHWLPKTIENLVAKKLDHLHDVKQKVENKLAHLHAIKEQIQMKPGKPMKPIKPVKPTKELVNGRGKLELRD